jgi:hypothetical protein
VPAPPLAAAEPGAADAPPGLAVAPLEEHAPNAIEALANSTNAVDEVRSRMLSPLYPPITALAIGERHVSRRR